MPDEETEGLVGEEGQRDSISKCDLNVFICQLENNPHDDSERKALLLVSAVATWLAASACNQKMDSTGNYH